MNDADDDAAATNATMRDGEQQKNIGRTDGGQHGVYVYLFDLDH